MIKLMLIGNLGKDATTNAVGSKQVINFAVAHTEKWKNAQGEQQSKTTWVDCSYWTDKTGVLPYLKKGTQVYVEGVPDIRTYEKDGATKAVLSLKIASVQLLGSSEGVNSEAANKPMAKNTISDVADDLPF